MFRKRISNRTRKRIIELFSEIDGSKSGTHSLSGETRVLIEEAITLSRDAGDEDLEYQARMRMTAATRRDTDTLLSSFSWCVVRHESDPVRFPENVAGIRLLVQQQWVVRALSSSPTYPQHDIDAAISGMRERYERAGVGMRGVLITQFEEAWMNGRLDEAERLYEQAIATPLDDLSCEACVHSQNSGFLAEIGREQEAVVLIEEMIDGGLSCDLEPGYARSQLLLPYLRAGRLDDAKDAYLRGSVSRNSVANNLIFCAVTGNEARGLALLERYIPWLARDGSNVTVLFSTLSAFGVLLDAVAASGHGELIVRGAETADWGSFFDEHDGFWTVADLGNACWVAAARIAEAFDVRNGNDYYAQSLGQKRTLAGERYSVPINLDTFIPKVDAEPTDAAGWFVRASELTNTSGSELALVAARNAITGSKGKDLALAHFYFIEALAFLGRWDEAEAALPARIAALREIGDARADYEQRNGLAMFGRATAADFLALEQELVSAVSPEAVARAQFVLAYSLSYLENPDYERVTALAQEALVFFEATGREELAGVVLTSTRFEAMTGDVRGALSTITRFIDGTTNRGRLAMMYRSRAAMHSQLNNFEAGARDADESARYLNLLDLRGEAVDVSVLAAKLYAKAGLNDEAIVCLRQVVAMARFLGIPSEEHRRNLARLLALSGSYLEAMELLVGLYQGQTEEITSEDQAETMLWLGHCYEGDDQPSPAIEAFWSAAELFSEAGCTQDAASSRLMAGKLLLRHEQLGEVVAVLAQAVTEARETPDLGLLADALGSYGLAQAHTGDSSGLAALDEAASLALEEEDTSLVADITDSRARALKALGRAAEAVPIAHEAADLFLSVGKRGNAAVSQVLVGNFLIDLARYEEAVVVLRNALELADDDPLLKSLIGPKLGDAFEGLGRTAEAAQARALAG